MDNVCQKLVELLHKGVRCPGVIDSCDDCPLPIMYHMEAHYGKWVLAEEQPFPKEDGRYFVYPGRLNSPEPIFFTRDGRSIDKDFSDGPTWYQYGEGHFFDERKAKVTHWLFLDNKNPTSR